MLPLLLLTLAPLLQDDPAKDLKSKDFAVRLAAVQRLAKEEHPKREKLLIGTLKDDDWEIVETAAVALGEVGSGAAIDSLVKLTLEGPARRVRRTAAEALAALDAVEGFDGLAKKVSGKHARHACEGMWSLAAKVDGQVSTKGIAKALKSKDGAARGAAAHAWIVVAGDTRAEALEELLGHEEIRVQAAALDGVSQSRDPACFPLLLGLLARNKLNDVLERRVVTACRSILADADEGERGALGDQILLSLTMPTDHAMQARTARLTGRLASKELGLVDAARAVESLESALGSSEAKTRAAAAGALGRIGTDEAVDRAAKLAVDDADANVRLIAMQSVVRRRPATEDATLDLLAERIEKDPDARVREEAAVALGVKQQERAVKPLAGALDDQEWGVVACAAVSLGKTRQSTGLQPLVDLYARSEDWRTRGAAVIGMGHMYEKEAVPHVIAALADEEVIVRRSALEYLVSLANRRMEPEVEPWEAWWAESGPRLQLFDPDEEAARREKYGYERTPAEIYAGLDVVVFESRGDHIQNVLEDLKIEHRMTQQGQVAEAELHARAVFVSNCTGEMTDEDVDQLAWFLRVGGYLFGSCWAVQETIERAYPGVVRRLPTRGEVLDNVFATPCVDDSPYLEGVFGPDVTPMYALEGAYLIDVVDPERCEVLVDSPECADRHGGGNLAAWFTAGHGVVLDSVNHFEEQGLTRATWLKKPAERQAFAVDHMGLSYEELRELLDDRAWKQSGEIAKKVKDLSVFRLITNFVRQKRITGDG